MMNTKLFHYSPSPKKGITKCSEKRVLNYLQKSSMDNFDLNQTIENTFQNTVYNSFHFQYLKYIPDQIKYAKKLFDHINATHSIFSTPLDQLNLKRFQEENEKLSILDHEKIDINYKKLVFLVCIMNHLYKQFEKDKNLKDYLTGELPFPQTKEELKIGGQYYLSSLLDNFGTVKKVNLCLFSKKRSFSFEKDIPFSKEAILIFEMLFPILFEGIMELNVDLNIYPYNNKSTISSDHPFPKSYYSLIRTSETYKDAFIANEIILRKLLSMKPLIRISIAMFDSYQVELNSLLEKELICMDSLQGNLYRGSFAMDVREVNTFTERNSMMRSGHGRNERRFENILIYFNEIFGRNIELHIMEMDFHFNSLDPLMFYSINHIVSKNDYLANLKMKFFNLSKVNINKICLNHFFFEDASKNQKYPNESEATAFLKSIKKENIEKKLLLLFKWFNNHLEALIIILSYRLKNFNNLYFDFTSSNNSLFQIYSNDDYRISINVFLFNMLICLQTYASDHKVNSFTFILDDISQSNIYLFQEFKKKHQDFNNGFDLSNTVISLITFDIPNISVILPFHNFPKKTLTFLELRNVTLTDFSNLCNVLSNNIHLFEVLQDLVLSFDYITESDSPTLKALFKQFIEDLLIPNLEHLTIEFKNNFCKEDVYELLYYIRNSKFHNPKQQSISYEIKICDKDVFSFLVERNQHIKSQGSFYHGLDLMNIKRKIRYEQVHQNLRNYNSLDLNVYSNNMLIGVACGMERIMKKREIDMKNKMGNVYKKICKFMGKTLKKKGIHFTKGD